MGYDEDEAFPPDDPDGLRTLTVSVSCYEGRLRSVALAELLAKYFRKTGATSAATRSSKKRSKSSKRRLIQAGGLRATRHASNGDQEEEDEEDEVSDEEAAQDTLPIEVLCVQVKHLELAEDDGGGAA